MEGDARMSNVRWYLITPSGQRMLDGTHEAIVLAPDKWQALEAAKVYWPTQMYVMMSVVEWEAKQREESAAQRFLDHLDRCYARAQQVEREYREAESGQLEMVVAA